MATSDSSLRFQAEHVEVEFKNGEKISSGIVKLYQTKLQILHGGNVIKDIPLARMASIDIHQPIFGANYIIGEYVADANLREAFTMTFNKGGATEFARQFFRVAEGQMVSSENPPQEPPTPPTVTEDKKNV